MSQWLFKLKLLGEGTAQCLLNGLRMLLKTRPVRLPRWENPAPLVILGNGPSLNEFIAAHPDFLENKTLLAVNQMVNTPVFERLKPALYVVSAPEYWLPDVEEDYQQIRRKLFDDMATKVTWPMHFYIPREAKGRGEWYARLRTNPHIHIHYYNNTPVEGLRPCREFLFDLKAGMPRPHNVLIPSLMTAVWSGFKEIYLAGADHSWLNEIHVTDDNVVLLTQKHFYDRDKARPAVMKKLGRGQRKLHEILEKFYYSFKAYHIIRQWAERKGVRIYNITPGSFIDAFPRKKV